MSADALDSVALAIGSLINAAYLHSPPPLRGGKLNDRPVQALLMLLDAAVAVASAIDDNILEGLQFLPVDDQNKIKSRLDKIAEKTTQPCAGAAKPKPFPVDLAALHDPGFSDGLSSIEHLNRLSGVAPASAQPAAIAQPAEDPTDDELLRTYGAARRNHQYDGPSDDWPNRAERAATVYGLRAVLTRYSRPTFQPIPVSQQLPGPDDCCRRPPWPGKWCWGWVQPGGMDRDDPIPYSGCWRMMRWEWLSAEALAWAPWWAFPLPGSHLPGATEEAGEEQP